MKLKESRVLLIAAGKTDISASISKLKKRLEKGSIHYRTAFNSPITQSGLCFEKFLVDMPLENPGDPKKKLALLLEAIKDVDLFILGPQQFQRHYKMIAFDMDSTFITAEVIDQIAIHAGVGEKVAEVTLRSMEGKLDFESSLKERVYLLKGVEEAALKKIRSEVVLNEGIERLIDKIKVNQLISGILSGGFDYFSDFLKERHHLDFAHANQLEMKGGKLTGQVKGQVVTAQRKKELLEKIGEQYGIKRCEMIAVGDGANDLPMLKAAGIGVAYKAKPVVKENADISIQVTELDALQLLIDPLQGFK